MGVGATAISSMSRCGDSAVAETHGNSSSLVEQPTSLVEQLSSLVVELTIAGQPSSLLK